MSRVNEKSKRSRKKPRCVPAGSVDMRESEPGGADDRPSEYADGRMAPSERPLDIVVFGANGVTGALTAQSLHEHASEGLTWAVAGRNREKLEQLQARLGGGPEILIADVTDEASLREVATRAYVVVTTVGPYIRYGEPLVEACAAEGTDYVDLTGEPEFVDRMWLKHHRTAEASGARIVHACGFDSVPHDLGAQFTVEQLPEGVPLTVRGFVRAGGLASGGTFDSAVTAFSRARHMAAAHRERKKAEGSPPGGRKVRAEAAKPHREAAVGAWAVPMPTIDPMVITHSARADERYGPDFTYGHYAAVKNPLVAMGGVAGVAGVFALSQLGPTRKAMLKLRPSGSGPTEEQREKGWFSVRFVGEGGGQRVLTEVRGGDPGYSETAKMLAESAMCLAGDDLPEAAGQVPTAQAMGPALRRRLERGGITFRVLERD